MYDAIIDKSIIVLLDEFARTVLSLFLILVFGFTQTGQ